MTLRPGARRDGAIGSPGPGSSPEPGSEPGARQSPVASASFPFHTLRILRELYRELGRGGLPSPSVRSPEESARIAAFCALRELVHVLDQFRRHVERGDRCRLEVVERGRQLGKVVIEIAIVMEP